MMCFANPTERSLCTHATNVKIEKSLSKAVATYVCMRRAYPYTLCILTVNYDDVISIKAESPKVNAKIKRRLDLCHHNFFLAGYEAQKVGLCSVDRQILNSQL